jgi:hypothetical protein
MSFSHYLDDPTPEEAQRRDDATRISALEDENEQLKAEVERLKEMHALNDALPEHYDMTDDATVEIAVDLAGTKEELGKAVSRLLDAAKELKHLANLLERARNRTDINDVQGALLGLAKGLEA